MIKRPLTFAVLLLVLIIAGLKVSGMPLWRDISEANEITGYLEKHEQVTVRGIVERREEKEKTTLYYLKYTYLIQPNRQFPMEHIYIIAEKGEHYLIGSTLTVQGEFRTIDGPGNPGQFDQAQYYHAKGIYYMGFADRIKTDGKSNLPREYCTRLRVKMQDYLMKAAGEQAGGVLAAVLLGERSGLTEEIKEQYRMGGILHILCISGLHITMIGMGIFRTLRRLRFPVIMASVLSFLLILLYGGFTGNSAATVRAVVMFAVVLGAKMTLRTFDFISAISLAALLMLLENPEYLFYSGFLMSFAAVFSAGVLVPLWSDKTLKKVNTLSFLRKRLWEGFMLWLFLLPVTAYYFFEVMPLGIIINFLFLPLVPMILGSGLAGAAVGAVCAFAGKCLLFPGSILLEGLSAGLGWLQERGSFAILTGQPLLAEVYLIYAGLGVLSCLRIRYPKKHRLLTAVLVWWMLILIFPARPSDLQITVLDVGQGDGIVVRSEDCTFLIDGGSSSEKQIGRYCLLPYLKSQGIGILDGIFLTHPDSDHVNGAAELLEQASGPSASVSVRSLYLPLWMRDCEGDEALRIKEAAKKGRIPVYYLKKEMRMVRGKLSLEVLHPDEEDYEERPNEGSLVLELKYGKFRGLLTGDLEKEGERAVLPFLERCDFLKVGHHGSREATASEMLQSLKPKISVISCGKKNRYGHPHSEVTERLEQIGCDTYITWKSGAVTVRTDGLNIWSKCFRTFDYVR